ncbi:hypothetical protein GCM10017790_80140 [Amycolatopsis oliviviridis]|uniref:Uncharacterized protein n=1 Tax=Amycolatopsis oliviviridis TaxID=1471590 RepID=A0ABQ3M966_9PSEU|nr:hypothetical protein GCM10017790_80140 [Amycolatopsis oliviviridis]
MDGHPEAAEAAPAAPVVPEVAESAGAAGQAGRAAGGSSSGSPMRFGNAVRPGSGFGVSAVSIDRLP